MTYIRVDFGKMAKYNDTINKKRADLAQNFKSLMDIMKAIPNEAWDDPEEKQYLEMFSKFSTDADNRDQQLAHHVKFTSGCLSNYTEARDTAVRNIGSYLKQ